MNSGTETDRRDRATHSREPGKRPTAAIADGSPTDGSGDAESATRAVRSHRTAGAGYAACVWALVFAAQSFYWAAGGTAGADTVGPAIADPVLARDPWWVAAMWGTGALKVIVGVLALALVRPWGRVIPRRLLLTAAWAAAGVMGLYEGLASLIQHGLMVAGVVGTPARLGRTAARWHLLLWDPFWLVGGVLFAVTARAYQRRHTPAGGDGAAAQPSTAAG